jgi:MATE family multidrug resistance protein
MHRRVWRLAAPIILSNLSIPLLGAVDTAVMGHLSSPAYIGGVAIGALIFSYVYWGFGFLRMGTTGLVAQAYGAGDVVEVRAILARAWLLAAGLAAALLLLQKPIGWVAFALLDTSREVGDLAARYYAIRIWGAPAALMNYVALGWLFGMQRMRSALALAVFMNGLNIVLDLVLVMGLGQGIAGVAWATCVSEWAALGLGLWLIARALRRVGGAFQPARIADGARLGALIRVNSDIFVRTLCLVTAFAWFTARGARLGEVLLAANAVLLNFQTFMAYGLDGLAHASEALIGGAIGARDPAALRASVRIASLWALFVAALFSAVYFLAGPLIIAAMTDIPEVRATAAAFLPWAAISPIISVWSFQLDGIFIGATRTPEMRNGMLISLACFLAAGSALIPRLGNHGLWLAFMIFMVIRALTLGAWYPRVALAIRRG